MKININDAKIVRRITNLDLHSVAVIEECMIAPYYGAEEKRGYRLIVTDSKGFCYHISCYETLGDARYYLFKKMGCDLYRTREEYL